MRRQALITPRILISDLDGTLIDSAPDLASAPARLTEAAVRRMIGDGVAKLVDRALAASGGAPDAGALATIVNSAIPGPLA